MTQPGPPQHISEARHHMGGDNSSSLELPPAKNPYPKARPFYRRPACVAVALLLGLGIILFLHQDIEGEVTTSATTIDAVQEEKEELAADDAEAAAAASAATTEPPGAADATTNAAANASPPPPLSADDVVELQLNVAASEQILRLRLKLTPQYSESSAAFVKEAAEASCVGELYRSERGFLVQGKIDCKRHSGHAMTKVVKGGCPAGVKVDAGRQCPSHDPQCGCHGPIMSHGMVGWAGGSAGPE